MNHLLFIATLNHISGLSDVEVDSFEDCNRSYKYECMVGDNLTNAQAWGVIFMLEAENSLG